MSLDRAEAKATLMAYLAGTADVDEFEEYNMGLLFTDPGVADLLLREPCFDPSAKENFAIITASEYGLFDIVKRLMQDERTDPSARENEAVTRAAENGYVEIVDLLLEDEANKFPIGLAVAEGHLLVVETLLQDMRVDPSDDDNDAVKTAAEYGELAILDRLLQDKRVDPSATDNYAIRMASENGYLAVVERLLQDKRVDPSACDNYAVRSAASNDHVAIVDRLLDDERVDIAIAIRHSLPENRKLFECRERLTEICIGLQHMQLPAWVTMKILGAACARSTLPLHSKWALVCAVKHFHDRRALD